MLGFNFKRSHTEGGGNTAALTLFGFWPRPRGLSKWVLLPLTCNIQVLPSVLCPWRRGESPRLREQRVSQRHRLLGPPLSAHPHPQVVAGESQGPHRGRDHGRSGQQDTRTEYRTAPGGDLGSASSSYPLMPLGKTLTFTCLICEMERLIITLLCPPCSVDSDHQY